MEHNQNILECTASNDYNNTLNEEKRYHPCRYKTNERVVNPENSSMFRNYTDFVNIQSQYAYNLNGLNCASKSLGDWQQSSVCPEKESFEESGCVFQSNYEDKSMESNTSMINSNTKRSRTVFQPHQIRRLQYEFQQEMYMVGVRRKKLSLELNLTEKQIKIWFQNKRMKEKRDRDRISRYQNCS